MTRPVNTTSDRPVLVVGSTGKTGRRVVDRLRAQAVPVREGARGTAIPFDWEDRSTWAPALSGVRAAYVTFYPDLAVPGAPEAIESFSRMAAEAGVEHLVLLSGRGEREARRAEEIVETSGMTWTVLRASWFMQNFSEGFLVDMVMDGTVTLPVGDVLEPFVDVDDIAALAVQALTTDTLDDRLLEVTGPRLMTFGDAVAEIAEATGRDVRFVEITQDEFLAGMLKSGLPGSYVQLVDYLFREVLDGRNGSLTPDVADALGRPAGDFSDYVARTVSAWTTEVAR